MRPRNTASALAAVATAALLVVTGLPACKKPAPPPPAVQAPVTAAAAKPAPAGTTPQAAEAPKGFGYSPVGFRDPFASLLKIQKVTGEIPEEQLTPLQRVSITDMKVEGIILMGKRSWAHVITPDGKAHIVKVGDPMGRNRGQIVRIESEAVVVEEKYEDYQGKEFIQETVLRLREKLEEDKVGEGT